MRVAVYSYLFGNYDTWRDPKFVNKEWDYYLFTNNSKNIYTELYKVIDIGGDESPYNARRYKIYAGFYELTIAGYDVIISHDSNLQIVGNLQLLIDDMKKDLIIMDHPSRNCVYDEYNACLDRLKDNPIVMYRQVQGYADAGYPENNGMVGSGVMLRRPTSKMIEFSKFWLNEVLGGSIRDQLSFNYSAWKMGFKYQTIPFWATLSKYFIYYNHNKK